MSFEFIKCNIHGLYEIQPAVFTDRRGYFIESYSEKDFFAAGLTMKFVQDNQSKSVKNVLRGLHFQKQYPQGRLVKVVDGKIFDVAVDLRKESPTFGKYHGVILDSEKHKMIYIPEGFAHGFCVLSDNAVIAYKCTEFYHAEDESGLMWNDPSLGIDWEKALPGISKNILLSEKDKKYDRFNRNNNYFDMKGKWIGSV